MTDLLSEGPVVGTGLIHLLGPASEHALWSNAGLDLRVDALESGVGDCLPSSLQLRQTLVVLHYSTVPVQVVGGAMLGGRSNK